MLKDPGLEVSGNREAIEKTARVERGLAHGELDALGAEGRGVASSQWDRSRRLQLCGKTRTARER
eukprot:1838200-Lingulodinium_polyedra.AAC.1